MNIRRLRVVTRENVRDINRLLKQLSSTPRSGTFADLTAMVADPTTVLVAIKDGTTIVGVATLYLMRQMGKRSGYVEDVVVDESYRGQGLGGKLMEVLIAEARKNKLDAIHLTSRPAREAANRLYQKLGFEHRDTNTYQLKL